MKFQLLDHWPGPGNMFVDAGTIIDGNDFPGMVMPLNARALDAEGLLAQCASYHPDLWHQLRFAPGLQLPYSPHHAPPQSEVHSVAPPKASPKGRFLMLEDFHAGNITAEAGTVVDWADLFPDIPPPITAKALSQDGLDTLCLCHGEEAYHLLHYDKRLRLPQRGFPPPAPIN
jgi:hypothetical protein